jgi:hypothetical protein
MVVGLAFQQHRIAKYAFNEEILCIKKTICNKIIPILVRRGGVESG